MTRNRVIVVLTIMLGLLLSFVSPANATVQRGDAKERYCDSANYCITVRTFIEQDSVGSLNWRTTWQVYCQTPGGTVIACRAVSANSGAMLEFTDSGSHSTPQLIPGFTCSGSCPLGAGGLNQKSGAWRRMLSSPPPYPEGVLEAGDARMTGCPRTGNECSTLIVTTLKYRRT